MIGGGRPALGVGRPVHDRAAEALKLHIGSAVAVVSSKDGG
jgi:hypothetical protein